MSRQFRIHLAEAPMFDDAIHTGKAACLSGNGQADQQVTRDIAKVTCKNCLRMGVEK